MPRSHVSPSSSLSRMPVLGDRDRPIELATERVRDAQQGGRRSAVNRARHRPGESEGLVGVGDGVVPAGSSSTPSTPRDCERPRDDLGVADRPADLQRLGTRSQRGRLIALRRRSERRDPEELASRPTGSRDPLEQGGEQAAGPRSPGPERPSRPTGPCRSRRRDSASAGSERQKSRALQTLARSARTRSNARPGAHRSRRQRAARSPIQSRWRERSVVLVTGFPEPLAAELAERFEEPEPVAGVSLSALDHGLARRATRRAPGCPRRPGRRRHRPPGPRRARTHRRTPTGAPTAVARARSAAGSSSRSRPRASAAGATRCGRRCPARRAGQRVPDRARRGRGR